MCWTQSTNPALTNDPVHGCPSCGEGVALDASWDERNTSKARMKIRCRFFHICFCHYLMSCKCIQHLENVFVFIRVTLSSLFSSLNPHH